MNTRTVNHKQKQHVIMGQAKIEPTNQVEASVYVTILRLIWKIFQLPGLEEDECLLLTI